MLEIGFALCRSFCTYALIFPLMEALSAKHHVIPIFSSASAVTDSRFGEAEAFLQRAEAITGEKPLTTLAQVEPIGPKKLLAKLAHSIADTPVTMAAKSQLRNGRPVLIAVSTNDALAGAAENIGRLLARRHYYFVPFRQDDPVKKPTSVVADFHRIPEAAELAVQGIQLQPILLGI